MLMGNCKHCYYNVRDDYEREDGTRDGYCHRFPKRERVNDMHFCGEHLNRNSEQLRKPQYRGNL